MAQTLAELQEELALYQDAERNILAGGQSVTMGGRRVDFADLKAIQARIAQLRTAIARLNAGGISHSQAVFGGRR